MLLFLRGHLDISRLWMRGWLELLVLWAVWWVDIRNGSRPSEISSGLGGSVVGFECIKSLFVCFVELTWFLWGIFITCSIHNTIRNHSEHCTDALSKSMTFITKPNTQTPTPKLHKNKLYNHETQKRHIITMKLKAILIRHLLPRIRRLNLLNHRILIIQFLGLGCTCLLPIPPNKEHDQRNYNSCKPHRNADCDCAGMGYGTAGCAAELISYDRRGSCCACDGCGGSRTMRSRRSNHFNWWIWIGLEMKYCHWTVMLAMFFESLMMRLIESTDLYSTPV